MGHQLEMGCIRLPAGQERMIRASGPMIPGRRGLHSSRRRRLGHSMLGASLLSVVLVATALADPGDLDPAFGGNGKVSTDFSAHFDGARGAAIQADGRVVAAGVANGRNPRFALARYNADGTLDSTFGGDGKVTTSFELGESQAFDVAIQADGRIVAVGVGGGFALARYNTDGTLDSTFGGEGRVTTNFHGGNHANAVVIQVDGAIVAAGVARVGADARFALARFLSI